MVSSQGLLSSNLGCLGIGTRKHKERTVTHCDLRCTNRHSCQQLAGLLENQSGKPASCQRREIQEQTCALQSRRACWLGWAGGHLRRMNATTASTSRPKITVGIVGDLHEGYYRFRSRGADAVGQGCCVKGTWIEMLYQGLKGFIGFIGLI